jgi:hypothetical protein
MRISLGPAASSCNRLIMLMLPVVLCGVLVLPGRSWAMHDGANQTPAPSGMLADTTPAAVTHTTGGPGPACGPLNIGIAQPCGSLSAISALSRTDIWAVGTNTNTTPNLVLLEHWNGRRWQVMPSTVQGQLDGVAAVTPTDVWAVGVGGGKTGLAGAMIMHYDGKHWSVVLQHTKTSYLYALAAVSTHDIWAVGSDENGSALLLHWNGVRWRAVPSPTGPGTDLLGVAAVSSKDVWAVGNQATITHWNGKVWRQFPFPPGGNPKGLPTGGGAVDVVLKALAVVSAHDIWAVGNYDAGCCRAGSGPVALHWNGTTWRRIPIPGIPNSVVTNVAGLLLTGVAAVSTRDVWAVSVDGAEHWDGTHWHIVPLPKGAAATAMAALSTRDIWAVGPAFGSGYTTMIAHWDGAHWSIVPSPNTNERGSNL